MKSFRKTLYLAVAGAAVGVVAAAPVLAAESLTVVSWGGAYTNSQVGSNCGEIQCKQGFHSALGGRNSEAFYFLPSRLDDLGLDIII